jgi:hypothetical protein
MAQRETWFRNLFRFAPWSVLPIHWKGWALLILGPLLLVLGGNMLMLADRPGIAAVIVLAGVPALFIAVYTHTSWDRG